jgi:alpha-tubulin suppressor-like RCC1 family protein
MSHFTPPRPRLGALLGALLVLASTSALAQGYPWGWGANWHGQVGHGFASWTPKPTIALGPANAAAATGGDNHTLILDSTGQVWACGYGYYGQLGAGSTAQTAVPQLVPGMTDAVLVAAGSDHSLALRSDGTVWAWGSNSHGQIGSAGGTGSLVPVQVPGLAGITAIGAGSRHSLAVDSTGHVWAFGYNSQGQLGDGTQTDSSSPVQVVGLLGVAKVDGGTNFSMALKTDGTVWAWGYNSQGALGDGTDVSSAVPVQSLGVSGAVAIAAGGYHSLALHGSGSLWSWGTNSYGQLGDGTTETRYTPVALSTISGVYDIDAGNEHTIALKTDGTVWTWGLNRDRQLGSGTDVYQSETPVWALGMVEITAIGAGHGHNMAIGPATRGATIMYAPNRSGVITDPIALRGYLRRSSDNAWLQGRQITFQVDGTDVGSAWTDGSGMAVSVWQITSGAATRPLAAVFAGDAAYTGSTGNATLTSQTLATKVYVVDRTAKVKGYTVLKAYLYTLANTPVSGRSIVLKLDGTELGSDVTRPSGYAQVGYNVEEGVGAGARTISGEWAGDGGYLASSNTGTLTVTQGDLYIWPYFRSAKAGRNTTMKAYVRSLPDYAIQPDKSIDFLVNGTLINTAVVGADGWASVLWSVPAGEPVGAHTGSAAFGGDAWYAAVTANASFNVVP